MFIGGERLCPYELPPHLLTELIKYFELSHVTNKCHLVTSASSYLASYLLHLDPGIIVFFHMLVDALFITFYASSGKIHGYL